MNITFSPSTTIHMYAGVPFDSDYKNIFWKGHDNNGDVGVGSYITDKHVATFSNYTVVKNEHGTGKFRVECEFTELTQCNYCCFQNPLSNSMGYIYAFVTDVNYINLNCAEVSYQVDYIHTFRGELEIGYCFVEREMVDSADDIAGNYLLDEGLDTGDYTISHSVEDFHSSGVMLYYLPDGGGIGTESGGVYTCCSAVASTSLDTINGYIDEVQEYPERVAGVFMCTSEMCSSNNGAKASATAFTIQRPTSFNGYTPVNQKLLTYPYTFLAVDNQCGQQEEYRWEFFLASGFEYSDGTALFQVQMSPTPKPCMMCIPMEYKGLDGNVSYAVVYDNFPACPYPTDTFKSYVSQQIPQILSSLVQMSVGAAEIATGAGSAVGALSEISGVTTLANTATNIASYSVHSKSYGGTISTAGLNYAFGRVGFKANAYIIRKERAKEIDSYFGRYGYRIDTYKIPNTENRTKYNYVKCSSAEVHGKAPNEALKAMENALLNGVTFWNDINIGEADFTENL